MPQHAPPPETDILCAHCGYGLNGLPDTGLCPECGQPIADSTTADPRTLPPWETTDGSANPRFFRTTRQIISSPAQFFRALATRQDERATRQFAERQHWLSAAIIGLATAIHMDLFSRLPPYVFAAFSAIPLVMLTSLSLKAITRLA